MMVKANKDLNWSNENVALVLLASLSIDVCPKWRLGVTKLAWLDRRKGLVMALTSLVATLGSEAIMLFVVGRETEQRLVQALAEICSRYICSLVKTVSTRLVMKEREENDICSTKLITACSLYVVCMINMQ